MFCIKVLLKKKKKKINIHVDSIFICRSEQTSLEGFSREKSYLSMFFARSGNPFAAQLLLFVRFDDIVLWCRAKRGNSVSSLLRGSVLFRLLFDEQNNEDRKESHGHLERRSRLSRRESERQWSNVNSRGKAAVFSRPENLSRCFFSSHRCAYLTELVDSQEDASAGGIDDLESTRRSPFSL